MSEKKNTQDSRKLAITIYDFLMDERCKNYSKAAKHDIDKAVDCIEKVYRISFTDYVMLKLLHPLPTIYSIGYHPVTIKNKLRAESYKRKGNVLMELELFKPAEMEFSKAVSLDPRNAIYYCNRAVSRIRQGILPDAVLDCNIALQLDKSYVKAYNWLGLAHAMMNHPAKAIRCYRKALRIEPDNEICITNMNFISTKLNRITLRIIEPLVRCSRSLARITNKIANDHNLFFRRRNEDSDKRPSDEYGNLKLQKFSLERLD